MCKTMKEETGITLSLLCCLGKVPGNSSGSLRPATVPMELSSDPKAPPNVGGQFLRTLEAGLSNYILSQETENIVF